MSAHDRYEALAGAIALGEATSAQRARFDAHATTCAACRVDAASGATMRAAIDAAHDGEVWRPSVTREVRERIARSRVRRSRATVAALGWTIALSFALDVAFVSGLANRLEIGLRDSGVALSSFATSFARVAFEPRARCDRAVRGARCSPATSPSGDVGFR